MWNWKALALFGVEFLILGVLANLVAHEIIEYRKRQQLQEV